jgi:anthranilate phosphoribosyltransferase
LKPEEIKGGSTVEESAKIFKNILEGKGTEAQNAVVIANAAMALYVADRSKGLKIAVEKARESLASGKADTTFQKLISKG